MAVSPAVDRSVYIGDAEALEIIGPYGIKGDMVPRRGLEPPRLAAQVPETCASTNSATWAGAPLM